MVVVAQAGSAECCAHHEHALHCFLCMAAQQVLRGFGMSPTPMCALCCCCRNIEQPLAAPPTLRSEPPEGFDPEGYEGELQEVAALVAVLQPWSEADSGWAFKPPR